MIANLKHAAFNRETVSIGGGEFTPAEIREFVLGHEALVEALYRALPFVEDLESDDGYKAGAVKKTVAEIRAAIAKAEAL